MNRFGAIASCLFFLSTLTSVALAQRQDLAATDEEIRTLNKAADPKGELNEAAKTIARLNAGLAFYLSRGQPDEAARLAQSLIMYAGLYSQKFGDVAMYALKNGDMKSAIGYLARAYDNIPRSRELSAKLDGNGNVHAIATDPRTGGSQDLGAFDAPQVFKLALGLPSGSDYMSNLTRIATGRVNDSASVKSDVPTEARALPSQTSDQLPGWTGGRPEMPARHYLPDLNPEQLFRSVAPSVYLVIAQAGDSDNARTSLGSAVAISRDMALTNCHVVIGHNSLAMFENNSKKPLKSELVYADPQTDRCILKSESGLNAISAVRTAKELSIGARVYTIGNPSGLSNTLGEGLISGLRQRRGIKLVQTTAQISPGSSGGALVDSAGALVGITQFFLKDAQNLNFAIAAEEYWH
jgi:Trypsin-like peptidase domain